MKYEISVVKHDGEEELFEFDVASIVSAFEQTHKKLQLKANLEPSQYKIIGASKLYAANPARPADGEVIRQKYDVPGGPNPVLEKKQKVTSV